MLHVPQVQACCWICPQHHARGGHLGVLAPSSSSEPQPRIWQRFHPKGFKTPPQPRASRSWKSFWGFFFSAAEAELLLGDWRNHKLLLVVSPDSKQIPGASRLPKLQNHLRGWQAEPPPITPSPLTWGKGFPTQNASWAHAACVHETRKPAAATCLPPSAHPSPS